MQRTIVSCNEIAPPHRLPEAQDHAKFGLQFARSNHEIETSEMALNGQFALHQFQAAHVGSGSFVPVAGAAGRPRMSAPPR
jgi:hypothetical protein